MTPRNTNNQKEGTMKIRNERIAEANADAAQARAEARAKADVADMLVAHAEGLHDEIPRDGCPDCDDKRNRVGP